MEKKKLWQEYISILENELVPALGCTEPIAIAYASALAAELLETEPEEITAACSGNIIKNTKSVVVPNTGGMKGIEAAAVMGAIAGKAKEKLEVLAFVTKDEIIRGEALVKRKICKVSLLKSDVPLHILITMKNKNNQASVEIMGEHTNVVKKEKNGKVVFQKDYNFKLNDNEKTDGLLNLCDILEFADNVELELVHDLIEKQISFNSAIAKEGLENEYGANIGKTLIDIYGNDIKIRAKAVAAAGSDARMSGCELPVVINSGSGNQGMTVSLPVIEYAKELGLSDEKLYRSLLVSNLVAIHQKTKIGRLSAYCGAVSAACGSGAAITYMSGGNKEQIANTIINTLANVSGIVCDGAKPSCAAKIASSVDAAIMAHSLSMKNNYFKSGDGLVKEDVEKTIATIGRLAKDGMSKTDKEIIAIMIEE